MIFLKLLILSLLFVVTSLAAPIEIRKALPVVQSEGVEINDLAQFLAGIQPSPGSLLAPYTTTSEWRDYAGQMDAKWRAFNTTRLQPIRTWRESAMSDIHPESIFYPFSGPDFVYAETYFPEARHFILCGLEPVGDTPKLERLLPLSVTLGWMKTSLKTVLDAGYFITKEMQLDLKMSPLQGTLPLLCVMFARQGDRILSIDRDKEHAVIHYLRAADGLPGTLDYFSVNLRDDGFKNEGMFVSFVKQSKPGAAYLKAASYLLHESDFGLIRNLLLTQCPVIVQDDSGIPHHYFDPVNWDFRVFGTYAPPLEIFKKYYQPEMADLYQKTVTAPLGFGAGYHWSSKTANLVIYTRSKSLSHKPQ